MDLRNYNMQRVRRIELRCPGWRPDAHPLGHTRLSKYSVVKDQCRDTRLAICFSGEARWTNTSESTHKMKKGGHLVAALLEIAIIPRRSGHLARVMPIYISIDARLRTFRFADELESVHHAL